MSRIVQTIAVAVILFSSSRGFSEDIAPGKSGNELIQFLRSNYRPTASLSYNEARQKMFGEIDNRGGKVRCVYTGVEIVTNGIPDGEVMNTEHSWPQSKFQKKLPMRADLHHLFPTLPKVNGVRGNNPYSDIPDDQTTGWWKSNARETVMPSQPQRDIYSESVATTFEPREDHKGNAARALLYFLVVYGGENVTPDWAAPQFPTLREWHQSDPVDQAERDRNVRVRAAQGNDNPFILDPTLVNRIVLSAPHASPAVARAASPIASGGATAAALVADATVASDERVRIATYNIEFLNTNISAARAAQLKEVVATLDADIIGLEEIADRAALERVFDPSEWSLVIDDQSSDIQDVAAAVRKPFKVLSPSSLDADDQDFLFPAATNNANWPNRRDGLLVEIETPHTKTRIHLVVVHAKARAGGRVATESRRVGAARDLIEYLEGKIDDQAYVVVGDYNDNPDDRSANILESGDPDAVAGPDQIEGPFMVNLTESLLAADRVSWGLSATNIHQGLLETRVPGSRDVNNASRTSTSNVISPILFDQIVVSPTLHASYSPGTIHVLDAAVAFQNGKASDHVPVYADFVFETTDGVVTASPETPAPASGVRIAALLPDPDGPDAGHEWVTIRNGGDSAVDLTGWRLRDRSARVKPLQGSIPAGGEQQISLMEGELSLNNSGDDLELVTASGTVIDRLSYSASQVRRGEPIVERDLLTSSADAAPRSLASPRVALRAPLLARAAPVIRRTARPEDQLAIISWNIQTGGTSTSATALRPPLVNHALNRILDGQYQILAAQEIPSKDSSDLLATMLPAHADPWQAAFTDTTSRMDNGFWFQSTVTLGKHEPLFATSKTDGAGRLMVDESQAFHPPHLAHFTVGDFDFTLITLHLTFHQGAAAESKREMQVLLDFLDAYFATPGHDPDVIICGDFNIPSEASGENVDGITIDQIIHDDGRFDDAVRGLRVFVDEDTSRSPVAGGGKPAKNYDHFILSSDCLEEFISAERLSTTVLTDDPEDPEERLTSDHFPIVARFRMAGDGVRKDVR